MNYHSKVLEQCLAQRSARDGLSYFQVSIVTLSLPKSYTIPPQSKMHKNSQAFVLLDTRGFFKLIVFFPFLHFLHFSLLLHMQTDRSFHISSRILASFLLGVT